MDEALRQRILKAKGAEKKQFEEIFEDERMLMYEAKKELVARNEEVLVSAGADLKKFERKYLKMNESLEKTQDEKSAEALLNSLQ
jgi:hypothetical protein